MKILNLEGRHLVASWRKQGHDVLCIGPDEACDVHLDHVISLNRLWTILKKHDFFPDLVFWNDNCRPPSVIGFETLPCPCIGFSIDQYCNPWHVPYSAAFDLILVAQKDYLDLFSRERIQPEAQWFPLFCNPQRDRDENKIRDVPVSFVGTKDPPLNPERKQFLENFQKSLSLFLYTGNYVPVFNRSRIVLNQSAVGELNFRIFQAAACGAAVLTEECGNGLHDLFEPNRNIFVYPRGNLRAAVQVCKHLLDDSQTVAQVAEAGREMVLRRHSAFVRAKEVIRYCNGINREKTFRRRIKNMIAVNRELGKAFIFLGTDRKLLLPEKYRRFYLETARRYQDVFPK